MPAQFGGVLLGDLLHHEAFDVALLEVDHRKKTLVVRVRHFQLEDDLAPRERLAAGPRQRLFQETFREIQLLQNLETAPRN